MNRSLKLSMLLALALGSTQAAALDLGQVQVKSALGQPLLAEIPLTSDSPAELRNLSARLASPEDFAHAGLSGARPDVPLQFAVVDVGGRKVIRITSAVSINDPYLDLLVEVDNASGRSLREFPILLDPPGTQPAPVVSAPRSASHGMSRAAPRSAAAPAGSAPTRPAASQEAAGGQYGPVERGQTLSSIARKLAPAGVDASQMMMALKQANPGAFYQDNINALKSGAVLRVPTSQDAQAMNVAAAMAEIRRQNSDWRAGAVRSTTTVADAATRAQTSSAPAGTSAADRLALVPAKEGGKGAGAKGGSGKGDAALRQDLLRSQESLTTLQQQSAELKSRLKDLQEINDKNTRLLALKDNEIAELQQKLADARKKAGLPAAATPPAAAAVSSVPAAASRPPVAAAAHSAAPATPASVGSAARVAGAASATAAHGAATAGTSAKPAVAPASKPVAKPGPAPLRAPAEEPWYMQQWAWAAAGGAVLLLILLALLGRRRKPAEPSRVTPVAPSLADRFGSMPAAPAASADPDQDELLDQLAEHPDDIGLHLELVSLYYSRRDVEHFEAAAEAMHAHIADPQQDEWQDVLAMGEDLVPGHPLFAGAGYKAPEAFAEEPDHHATEALHSFDLGSYPSDEETNGTPSIREPASAKPKVSEYHFDFDLTPPRPNPAAPSEAADTHMAVDDDRTVVRNFESVSEDEEPAHSSWAFEEPVEEAAGAAHAATPHEPAEFSDDPIDTKLDLARAYMDMGDADGARAMLEEVMNEGSRTQKDAAQRLLDSLA
ncbi:MAG TPA: FimV/HubP family polar landmark protein [Frateuria sp.]|uniref:FimV/HubP family polar landmark protein n=1 Tax=Frateuria sp. TaxID=2211372 RepID=UPI002DF3425F|nr:FimV/HubP family polar landmark protein [Frateuria sp.]